MTDSPDDRPLAQWTAADLESLIRKVVRETIEDAGLVTKPRSAPLGLADMHAAAKHFGTSYTTVRDWIVNGDAPAVEIERAPQTRHRQWRIDLGDMDLWIRGGGVEALERKRQAERRNPTAEDFAALEAFRKRLGRGRDD